MLFLLKKKSTSYKLTHEANLKKNFSYILILILILFTISPDGEMVDTIDSKSIANKRGGSSPLQGKYLSY